MDNTSKADPFTLTVAAGVTNTNVDFGYYRLGAAVGNRVWQDLNGNGIQDAGEPGLAGAGVRLVIAWPNGAGSLTLTTTSAADGGYAFGNLLLDEDFNGIGSGEPTFVLSLPTAPAGFVPSPVGVGSNPLVDSNDPAGATATLAKGQINMTVGDPASEPANASYDFGYSSAATSVTGHVYIDTNGNGTQDPGEPNLPNVAVTLTDRNGATFTVLTDANGNYLFTNVLPGATSVAVNTSDPRLVGYTQTEGTNPTPITVPPTGSIFAGNDGFAPPAGVLGAVTGVLYIDTNANGVQDPGEVRLPNVSVTITDALGGTYTVVSDVNGVYTATGVLPGTATVAVDRNDPDIPAGYVHNTVVNPSITDLDPSNVLVVGGTTVDAGKDGFSPRTETLGSLTGRVYIDSNGNGTQDPGEPGAPGITVTIVDKDGAVRTVQTNATGDYSVSGIPAGLAVVTVDAGDPSLAAHVQVEGTNPTTVTVVAGQTADAGKDGFYPPTGAIGNRVWLDENGNGVQDAGEAGIPNLTVQLLAADGTTVLATTMTDTDGGYLFFKVPAGLDYYVRVTATAGLVPTYDEDGIGTPSLSRVVDLQLDEEHLTADFGYNWVTPTDSTNPAPGATGAIGDRLWIDADGDGLQGPGEAGLAGVTVRLLTDPDGDGVFDTVASSKVTDGAGQYLFDDLPAGAYVVAVDPATLPVQANGDTWAQTGDPDATLDHRTTRPVILAPGDVWVNADFGYQLRNAQSQPSGSTIGDLVFLDVDASGGQTAGDVGVAGVTLALMRDVNGNGVRDGGDPVIASTITGPAGQYSFPGLPAGDYLVAVTDTENVVSLLLVPVYDASGPADGLSAVTVNGTDNNLLQDFGYWAQAATGDTGTIGDTVFLDRNGNGAFDPGEGLEGVTVGLYDSTGNVLLGSIATFEGGTYGFVGLPLNQTYVVRIDTGTLPGAMTNTVDPDGGTANQSVVALTTGSPINLAQDFGYRAPVPSTIAGTLWVDTNANGTLDPAETGRHAGVTVELRTPGGNLVGTTQTDALGNYSFTGLPAGTYFVHVTDQANLLNGWWTSVGPNPGADNNSQVDPYQVTVTGGQTNSTADFGYFRDGAALGNRTWLDANNNGLQDPTEVGAGGVRVTLLVTYPNGDTSTVVAVSDGTGLYSFANLLLDESFSGSTAGDPTVTGLPRYRISAATAPVGYFAGTILNAGNGRNDSDNHNGVTAAALLRGENNVAINAANPSAEPANAAYDFAYLTAGTVTGRVYEDVNRNGIFDSGDLPQAGVDVVITDSQGNPQTVQTDANGIFTAAVPPGPTTVNVDETDLNIPNPSLTTNAQGEGSDPTVVNVPAGGTASDNTGYVRNTQAQLVTGRVYEDKNGNGLFDAGTDVPQSGVTVVITDANGGVYSLVTNATGQFSQPVAAGATVVDVIEATLAGIANPTLTTNANGEGSDPTTVTVPAGSSANDNTGYVSNPGLQSVNGTVYIDNDYSGTFTAGDTPLPGVTLVITDSQGGVYTVVTNANGGYSQPVAAGSTVVNVTEATLPTGSVLTIGNVDPNTVTVPSGGTATDNRGYLVPSLFGTVFGHLYVDTNGNGVQDTGEPNLPNVNVIVTDSNGNPQTVVTDANGNWTATVPPGTTTVNVDVNDPDFPAGYVQTEGTNPTPGTAVAGSNVDAGVDGFAPTWFVGDFVWHDTNRNGLQDPEEQGVAGVTVSLSGNNNLSQPVSLTTRADGSGYYVFPDLLPGTYTLTFAAPAGYSFTAPDQTGALGGLADAFDSDVNGSGVTPPIVLIGDNVTVDAGLYLTDGVNPARISDRVWYDTNGNGIQDSGEPGVAGVVVELRDAAGTTTLATMVTDGSGYYQFSGLPAGNYRVLFTTPSGYSLSPKYATGAGTPAGAGNDSDANVASGLTDQISLAAGQQLVEVDAGMFIDPDGPGGNPPQAPAGIGDRVWYDSDGDGIQDAGEPGIPGVRVYLLDEDGVVLAIATTDPLGAYAFTGLPAGTYGIGVELPTGYDRYSPQAQGGNPALDSDINPLTGIAPVTLAAGQVKTDIDAGLFASDGQGGVRPPIVIGDYLWLDVNPTNGQPDNGEWFNGIGVVLYDALGFEVARVRTATGGAADNYRFTGVVPGDYRVAVDTSTLPSTVSQIADPDSVLDHQTVLINQTANVATVDFGYRLAVPDLTPVITLIPNVMVGPTNFEVWVQCIELLGADTSGQIRLRVPKDSRWTLTNWNQNATSLPVSGRPLDNSIWTLSEDASALYFTTSAVILGKSQKNFGFSASWSAGLTVGAYTASVSIDPGSGGEVRINNNTNAEVANYSFQ